MDGRLPAALVDTVTAELGDRGRLFLASLPELVEDLAIRWGLGLGLPYEDLSYHYVCRATRDDGTPAVLKVGVPHDEMRNEIAALRHFDGRGMARLYQADEEEGALLLERLDPGATLSAAAAADDDAATRIAAGVMRGIWREAPPDHDLWNLDRWFQSLWLPGETVPNALVVGAAATARELIDTTAEPVLLHGDLHHFNILSSGSEWRAIDPKGLVGDPAFELAAFCRNPHEPPLEVVDRRLGVLCAELGLDRERVCRWLYAEQVLNACWSLEAGEVPEFQRKLHRAAGLLSLC